jgi:hypothetical protein
MLHACHHTDAKHDDVDSEDVGVRNVTQMGQVRDSHDQQEISNSIECRGHGVFSEQDVGAHRYFSV